MLEAREDLPQIGDDLVLEPLVEGRQGLVHQQQPGTGEHRPPQGDALPLAAGEGGGVPVEQGLKVEDPDQFARIDAPPGRRGAPVAVEKVAPDAHVGKEVGVLEDDGDTPPLRGNVDAPLCAVERSRRQVR